MSTHYSGGFELGLLLRGDDALTFKENYYRSNKDMFTKSNLSKDEVMDKIEEALCGFDSLIGCDGEYFNAWYINEDHYLGAYFISACHWKVLEALNAREYYIFINATKQPYTRGILRGNFYTSFDEIKLEFQLKCGKYLPENFSYEDAIGDLEYAYLRCMK